MKASEVKRTFKATNGSASGTAATLATATFNEATSKGGTPPGASNEHRRPNPPNKPTLAHISTSSAPGCARRGGGGAPCCELSASSIGRLLAPLRT